MCIKKILSFKSPRTILNGSQKVVDVSIIMLYDDTSMVLRTRAGKTFVYNNTQKLWLDTNRK